MKIFSSSQLLYIFSISNIMSEEACSQHGDIENASMKRRENQEINDIC